MLLALTTGLLLAQAPAVPAAAPAPGFEATFTPEAVGSQLEGRAASLVVGAGRQSPALAAAAAAVEEALRRSGKAELVMNGQSLGPVAELDDQALVKRCEPLPVARVLVVRAFEAPGEAPRAVVTVYDKRGTVLAAFTAQAGQPLLLGSAATAGTAPAAPSVAQAVLQASSGAQEEYERSYVGIDELAAVGSRGQLLTWSTPYQGKYRRPLEGDEFYQVIGRADLVQAYQANRKKRLAFIGVGVGIAVVTPAVAFLTRSQRKCPGFFEPGGSECDDANTDATIRAAFISVGGLAAGTLVATLGLLGTRLHPVEPAEARQLADEHNKKLKARLGLAAAPPQEPRDDAPQVAVSLLPVRGGGMVGLAIRF